MHAQTLIPETESELSLEWTQACACFKSSIGDSNEDS